MSHRHLDLDVLRTFVCGVELGSFARAADQLARSPSAISAQLKKLEASIGAPVLQKSGRGLTLTPRGELLLAHARRLLALNDETLNALGALDMAGSVRIGLQEDFGEHLLPGLLAQFARAHPGVLIQTRVARNADLLHLTDQGELDLALVWETTTDQRRKQTLGRWPLHWIGNDPTLAPSAAPLPLVVLDAPCRMRTEACLALDQQDLPWRITLSSHSLGGVWAAVSAGLGVTVRTRAGLPPGLHVLTGWPALPDIGLALLFGSDQPSRAVQYLGELLLQQLHAPASPHPAALD